MTVIKTAIGLKGHSDSMLMVFLSEAAVAARVHEHLFVAWDQIRGLIKT